jgi:hypothetical protein
MMRVSRYQANTGDRGWRWPLGTGAKSTLKGPGRGYVRVWGPSANPQNPRQSHVIIELWNGVVGVRAPLHQHIPGTVARVTTATIVNDPLGYGCGPNFGGFSHAIPSSAMGPGTLYPDARSIVVAVLSAFAAAGMPW